MLVYSLQEDTEMSTPGYLQKLLENDYPGVIQLTMWTNSTDGRIQFFVSDGKYNTWKCFTEVTDDQL